MASVPATHQSGGPKQEIFGMSLPSESGNVSIIRKPLDLKGFIRFQ